MKYALVALSALVSGASAVRVSPEGLRVEGTVDAHHGFSKSADVAVHDHNRMVDLKAAAFMNGWTAGHNDKWEEANLADVQAVLGTFLQDHPQYDRLPAKTGQFAALNKDLPSDFDSRTQWPSCPSISLIRDQSSCGSCWAFGSTEAFNDRLCIATNNTVLLSVEDTTACCGHSVWCAMSMGCNGGQPSGAWNWFHHTGVVTGGDYQDTATCEPYTLAPCSHHVTSPKYQPCPQDEYPTPSCTKECQDGYATKYSDDKVKAKSSYSVDGVQDIMAEIMTNGPVSAAFTVYDDFPTYKSGVYVHGASASPLGGHAIRILGWGTEDGKDYWTVANSWNDSWGDGGTFKIARGTNECGIEGDISAGTA